MVQPLAKCLRIAKFVRLPSIQFLAKPCWIGMPVAIGLLFLILAGWVPARSEGGLCNFDRYRIAVDVGHSPEAPGAMSARGVAEYKFNFELANQIAKGLTQAGFEHTVLIVTKGVGKPQLVERSARANALGVNALISVHHDDVQPRYYRDWRYSGKSRHFSDTFSGFSLFVSMENSQAAKSLFLAKAISDELRARGLRFTTHHAEKIPGEAKELIDPERGVYRYDKLLVLRMTKGPSVLLEAGIIVNRNEEIILGTAERQQLISAAVVDGVIKLCAIE